MFFSVQYHCLLEMCSEKFKNPTERKIHCIELHRFPSDFRFDLSWRKLGKEGNKNATNFPKEEYFMECEISFIKGENPLQCNSETSEVRGKKNQNENVKKAAKVPCNLSFGVGVARGFSRGAKSSRSQGKKVGTYWHQRKYVSHSPRTKLEEVNMKDLEAALPSESECL